MFLFDVVFYLFWFKNKQWLTLFGGSHVDGIRFRHFEKTFSNSTFLILWLKTYEHGTSDRVFWFLMAASRISIRSWGEDPGIAIAATLPFRYERVVPTFLLAMSWAESRFAGRIISRTHARFFWKALGSFFAMSPLVETKDFISRQHRCFFSFLMDKKH